MVVVGAGAAGLNAAMILGRSRRRVAVVDAGEPRNAPAEHLHGFLSRDGMPPSELLAAGRAEVAAYGGELIDDRVVGVEHGYYVRLAGGRVLRTRRLLVATGLRDGLPVVPGVTERFGRDVVHCPYCHGYEIRDQRIGVLASGERAGHQALLARQLSDDIVLFTHTVDVADRERLTAAGIRLVDGEVRRLVVDDDRITGVELGSGEVVPRDAVFVAPDLVPNDLILTSLGCETADGKVTVDPTGRTSVYGVWAAGNVTDPYAGLIHAAAAGFSAATAINLDLVEEDADRALQAQLVG